MAAIFFALQDPADLPMSRLKIAAASCSISRAKSYFVVSRSPVVIGIREARPPWPLGHVLRGAPAPRTTAGRTVRAAGPVEWHGRGHLAVRADQDVAAVAQASRMRADHRLGGVQRAQRILHRYQLAEALVGVTTVPNGSSLTR